MQIEVARILSRPEGPRALAAKGDLDLSFIQVAANGASTLDRLSVYSDAYFLRLREILQDDFELARVYLGATKFNELVVDYLKAHPPSHPNAVWVGAKLAAFVEGTVWSQYPLLMTIVKLEWAASECVYSEWVEERAHEQLPEMSADDLAEARFECDPSVRLVESPQLIEDLWVGRHRLAEVEASEVAQNNTRPWLVLRRGQKGEIRFMRMSDGERQLWCVMDPLKTLTEICEKIEDSAEAVQALGQMGEWIQRGLIKTIVINSSSEMGEDRNKGDI